MPQPIRVACHSERGRRKNNEDMIGVPSVLTRRLSDERTFLIQPDTIAAYAQKGYLFLLADGVGGSEGGEIASRLVVKEVATRYYRDPSTDLATSLQRVVEATNRQLRRLQEQARQPKRMATTLVAIVIQDDQMLVVSVGDSRVYRLQNHQAELVTSDHSWVQEQIDRGVLAGKEKVIASRRNKITRCLGSRDQVGVDMWRIVLMPRDRVLLCSDGLSSYLDKSELIDIGRQSNLQKAVNRLIDTAYDNGSPDNISAVLVEPFISS